MSAFAQAPKKCASAAFKEEGKLQECIQRLLNRGIPNDRISIIGRNFQTEAKITGFITRKEVVLDGLTNGAIYGSLFGSLLGLLTGVGVLFIPFLGAVVAAGPLGAALLGATGGALYGALGAGLGSALIALGMPQEKAAIYQTRVQAGEFLLVVQVPEEKSGEIYWLCVGVPPSIESSGLGLGSTAVHSSYPLLTYEQYLSFPNPRLALCPCVAVGMAPFPHRFEWSRSHLYA